MREQLTCRRRVRGRSTHALLLVAALAVGCRSANPTEPTDGQPPPARSAVTSAPAPPSTTTAATTATTAATPTPTAPPRTAPVTVPPPEGLRPLVAGHNDVSADRINLIVAPWGWDDLDEFEAVAVMYLGWDRRAQWYGPTGQPVATADEAAGADLGLFGFEPFRSHRTVFNVWITDTEPPGPALWLNDTVPAPFDLPDQSVVVLALDPWEEVPGISSVAGLDTDFGGRQTPRRLTGSPLANAMVAVPGGFPAGAMRDLPHELGHALFGLADEYVGRIGGDGAPRRDSYWPSCAADRETAAAWWGDLIGEVDPMLALWAAELAEAGFAPPDDELALLEDAVRIHDVEGGCHGDPGSYRAAEDTMMGFNAPAFGLVNLRHAQAVLALWDGQ